MAKNTVSGSQVDYLRGDGTLEPPPVIGSSAVGAAGGLLAANNLSDVASAPTSLANLGGLPLTGGTMSGAIAMGSNKVTGLTNGSASSDAAAFGQVPVADATASHIAVNGTQAAGGNGEWADSGHVHPGWGWMPADNGLLVASGDLRAAVDGVSVTSGSVFLVKLWIRSALTITNLWFIVSTAATGTSSGSYVGLYSSAGSLLSGSSDIATPLASQGAHSVALTSAQALSGGTFVWAAFLQTMSGTQPQLAGANYLGSCQNMNLTAANYAFAINGTVQTSLPSPSITPASNNNGGGPIWIGAN